jgi:hypothetical protein
VRGRTAASVRAGACVTHNEHEPVIHVHTLRPRHQVGRVQRAQDLQLARQALARHRMQRRQLLAHQLGRARRRSPAGACRVVCVWRATHDARQRRRRVVTAWRRVQLLNDVPLVVEARRRLRQQRCLRSGIAQLHARRPFDIQWRQWHRASVASSCMPSASSPSSSAACIAAACMTPGTSWRARGAEGRPENAYRLENKPAVDHARRARSLTWNLEVTTAARLCRRTRVPRSLVQRCSTARSPARHAARQLSSALTRARPPRRAAHAPSAARLRR